MKAHHIPTAPRHPDRLPYATHNEERGPRICMQTVVSYLRSRAFRTNEDGTPGEGQVFNTITLEWEELDVEEKEQLLGFTAGSTAAEGVTEDEDERAVRVGRALDGNTMRWMGAYLHASQA